MEAITNNLQKNYENQGNSQESSGEKDQSGKDGGFTM